MTSHDEIKVQLMSKVEAIIDKTLSNRKPDDEITLHDIENLVLEARQEIGEELLETLVEVEESRKAVCPKCGSPAHYKGMKSKTLVTRGGEVTLKRAYFYCKSCREGFFPPG